MQKKKRKWTCAYNLHLRKLTHLVCFSEPFDIITSGYDPSMH